MNIIYDEKVHIRGNICLDDYKYPDKIYGYLKRRCLINFTAKHESKHYVNVTFNNINDYIETNNFLLDQLR